MSDEMVARAQLSAVAAIVGIPVTVTDDDFWHIDLNGLRVGLGWYQRRGHSGNEAAALALLQLWEGVRGPRLEPARAARCALLIGARPELEPLVRAILRAQTASEVLTAFPGLRGSLVAALHRGLPADLASEARRDQWLALTLIVGFGAEPTLHGLDTAVRREWVTVTDFGGAAGTAVVRVLRPDPDRTALARFERALALLSPGYERLLALDAAQRGLGGGQIGPEETEPAADDGAGKSEASGPAEDQDAAGEPEREETRDDNSGGEEPPAHARPGGGDIAEGADLFQAEQAGQVTAFLDTPLPAEGALAAAFAHREADANDRHDGGTARGGGAAGQAHEYSARMESLGPSIEHMRAVWREVTAERIARVATTGRNPETEGDRLDVNSLATGLAEAHAGVRKPRVFLQRQHRVRRTQRPGNTDYLMLIDRSASMQGRPARAAADAAVVMLEGLAAAARDIAQEERAQGLDLELQIRTGLIVFDARAHIVKPLSVGMSDELRDDLVAAIMTPQGSTNDAAALSAATEQLSAGVEARQRRRVAFVLSDGGTNDQVAAAHALRRLRATGATVFGIGLGSDDLRERYAPSGARVDEPELLAGLVSDLIERHLPAHGDGLGG